MDWSNRTLSPKPDQPPKIRINYPCPGLSRFAGMVSFLIVSLVVFYGGADRLGIPRLDWAAPVWTFKHVLLVIAAIIFGMLSALFAFASAMRIEVRNEKLNDLIIVLWQFLANGSMIWFLTLGIAMSISLGKEEAKMAVLNFGAERAMWYLLATASFGSLLSGIAFYMGPIMRLPLIVYFIYSASLFLAAAWWYYSLFGIQGQAWIGAGLVTPILILIFTPSMIERDRRQRRLIMDQRS